MKPGAPLQVADIDKLDFGKGDGLIPAIVQDAASGAVLMLAYMNHEALIETFARRRVVFFSRSKQRLWEKGETSGHTLDFVEARADCDGDTLLVKARPRGPACHLGSATCFAEEPPAGVSGLGFLATLEAIIEQRMVDRPESSYTTKLLAAGPRCIAQKVGEEGVELALAAVAETDDKVIGEAADLLFHTVVLLASRGVRLGQVVAELESRHAGRH